MSEENKDWDIHEPTRQSYLGVIVYLLRNLRALGTLLISLVAVAAAAPMFWTIMGIAIIPLLILFALFAYWQYRNFTFHVEGDNLIIHKGVLVKDRKSVPIERIQSIQVTKNVIQRLLGLVALKVDTAGSRGNELEIPALERDRADALRDLLYQKKEALLITNTSETDEVTEVDQAEAPKAKLPEDEGRVLVKLGLFDLLKVGLTENHLKTGFIALAFVFGYASQYQELLQEYIEGYVDTYASQVTDAGIAVVISFLIFYAIVSVLISLVRTLLRFFDLKAVLKSEALEISTGLLQRNEYRIPKNKIQYIQWETNPLRKLAGYESATIKPSNSVGEVANKQSIEIPALRIEESNYLATGVFPGAQKPDEHIDGDPWAYARLHAIIGAIIFAPLAGILYWQYSYPGIAILLLVGMFAAYGYRYGKTVRVHFDEKHVYILRGWLFPKRVILPSYKTQSLQLTQNIILKRRKLCHLTFFTAAGSKTVRFLNEREALEVYNSLIYAVEKYEGSWM
ncbi:PH domain-containing protein [Cryomorphaceae bacterium 1068]|nr:PH domain-containing protein [Cryomorphaceae bacterium 1068]